jgi:hypothetical protein
VLKTTARLLQMEAPPRQALGEVIEGGFGEVSRSVQEPPR